MNEILPGVLHWTRRHPNIGKDVSSYYLAPERTLLDPLEPAEGFASLEPAPEHVLLTNRHHYRDCAKAIRRFGCDVRAPRPGMHEFTPEQRVTAYAFGDELPGGIHAHEVGALCPDEGALLIPREGGILALADGAIREGDGPLQFVPDFLIGEDPEAVKAGLRAAYATLLALDFAHLLLAHGAPIVGEGKAALERFIAD